MTSREIIQVLPYAAPFLFVDELLDITESGATGRYTYKQDEFFYRGHFTGNPVTPGVILIETMAQIGVVSLGIYLSKEEITGNQFPGIALTSAAVDFLAPVFPGETVTVNSKKKYFRFGKLSCDVEMKNSEDKIVCAGNICGILKPIK